MGKRVKRGEKPSGKGAAVVLRIMAGGGAGALGRRWTAALTDAWPATQGIQNVIIQNVICGWGCNAPETAISWTAAGEADHISWSGPQMAVYSCFDLHNIVDIKY